MSFMNEDLQVNEEYTTNFLPPVIQWHRGDLKDQNPSLKNGCWQLPRENFEVLVGNHLPLIDVVHGGGTIVTSYLLDKIHIAILAWKKRWYVMDEKQQKKYLPGYVEGARSNLAYYNL